MSRELEILDDIAEQTDVHANIGERDPRGRKRGLVVAGQFCKGDWRNAARAAKKRKVQISLAGSSRD